MKDFTPWEIIVFLALLIAVVWFVAGYVFGVNL